MYNERKYTGKELIGMIEYSKFYKVKNQTPKNDSPKSEETIRKEAELAEYKKLIQKLGYAYFDD
jgi:hypothetical protein